MVFRQNITNSKVGINPLLDVARKTYVETIEEMHNIAARYREEYNIPSIKLQFGVRRGHYIAIDAKAPTALPDLFLQGNLFETTSFLQFLLKERKFIAPQKRLPA